MRHTSLSLRESASFFSALRSFSTPLSVEAIVSRALSRSFSNPSAQRQHREDKWWRVILTKLQGSSRHVLLFRLNTDGLLLQGSLLLLNVRLWMGTLVALIEKAHESEVS